MPIKDFRMSLSRDSVQEVETSFKSGTLVINVLNDKYISEFLDTDLIRGALNEFGLVPRKTHTLLLPVNVTLSFQGTPLLELYPDGTKKIHRASAANFGLKLIIKRIAEAI